MDVLAAAILDPSADWKGAFRDIAFVLSELGLPTSGPQEGVLHYRTPDGEWGQCFYPIKSLEELGERAVPLLLKTRPFNELIAFLMWMMHSNVINRFVTVDNLLMVSRVRPSRDVRLLFAISIREWDSVDVDDFDRDDVKDALQEFSTGDYNNGIDLLIELYRQCPDMYTSYMTKKKSHSNWSDIHDVWRLSDDVVSSDEFLLHFLNMHVKRKGDVIKIFRAVGDGKLIVNRSGAMRMLSTLQQASDADLELVKDPDWGGVMPAFERQVLNVDPEPSNDDWTFRAKLWTTVHFPSVFDDFIHGRFTSIRLDQQPHNWGEVTMTEEGIVARAIKACVLGPALYLMQRTPTLNWAILWRTGCLNDLSLIRVSGDGRLRLKTMSVHYRTRYVAVSRSEWSKAMQLAMDNSLNLVNSLTESLAFGSITPDFPVLMCEMLKNKVWRAFVIERFGFAYLSQFTNVVSLGAVAVRVSTMSRKEASTWLEDYKEEAKRDDASLDAIAKQLRIAPRKPIPTSYGYFQLSVFYADEFSESNELTALRTAVTQVLDFIDQLIANGVPKSAVIDIVWPSLQ